jgi:hypothetical protein
MPGYKCSMCLAVTKSNKPPTSCDSCGTTSVQWTILLPPFLIISNVRQKMIIYKDIEIGRKEIRQFFDKEFDTAGNQLHKYCDDKTAMLFYKE